MRHVLWTTPLASLVTFVAVGCGHPNPSSGVGQAAGATAEADSPVPAITDSAQAPATPPVTDPKPATPVAAPVPIPEAPSKPTSNLATKPLAAAETHRGKSLSEWIAALVNKDEEIRVEAVDAVAQYGPNAKDVTPALIKILNDPRDRAFINAFTAVRAIGPDAGEAVPRLVELLRHNISDTRGIAAVTLSDLGPAAGKAVPALIDRLGDDANCLGGRVSDAASVTLTKIGKYDIRAVFAAARSEKLSAYVLKLIMESLDADDGFAVEGLAEQLKREDLLSLTHAMIGLKRIGPKAAQTLPALRTHAEGADKNLKDIAAKAMAAIDPSGKFAGPIKKDVAAIERPVVREASKGDPKENVPMRKETEDISDVLAKAGLKGPLVTGNRIPNLNWYIRCGSREVAIKYIRGDQVEKAKIDKDFQGHREAVRKRSFRFNDLNIVPLPRYLSINDDGRLMEIILPIRVRGEKPFNETPTAVSGVLTQMRASEADLAVQSFLTKEGTLRACTLEEAALVIRRKGVVYHPEKKNTSLVVLFKDTPDVMAELGKNYGNFRVEVDVSDLRLERPFSWGYFRLDAYNDAGRDCEKLHADFLKDENNPQPVYFPIGLGKEDEEKIPEVVHARLDALRVLNKDGKVVGGYRVK